MSDPKYVSFRTSPLLGSHTLDYHLKVGGPKGGAVSYERGTPVICLIQGRGGDWGRREQLHRLTTRKPCSWAYGIAYGRPQGS